MGLKGREIRREIVEAIATKKIRVLLSKVGLDAHDRGIKFIARALRNAAMEVIYLGRHQTPEAIVVTAAQEDVDVIGLSFLSSEYNHYAPMLIDLLKSKGMNDIVVVVGGLILGDDSHWLQQKGIGVFGPGATAGEVVKFIRKAVFEKRGKKAAETGV